MSPRTLIPLLLAGLIGLPTLVPAQRGGAPAPHPSNEDRPHRDHRPPHGEGPESDWRAGDPPPPGPERFQERMGRDAERIFDRLHRYREEARRIIQDERRLEQFTQQDTAGLSDERIERRDRMADLQRELLQLQKDEYMDQIRVALDKAIERVQAQQEEDSRFPKQALAKMEERLTESRAAATDFDSFVEQMREFEEEMRGRFREPAPRDGDPRVDRIERELQHLEGRIERLYRELDLMNDMPHPPPPGAPPPREMRPDEQSQFYRGDMPPGHWQKGDHPNRQGRAPKDPPPPPPPRR